MVHRAVNRCELVRELGRSLPDRFPSTALARLGPSLLAKMDQ